METAPIQASVFHFNPSCSNFHAARFPVHDSQGYKPPTSSIFLFFFLHLQPYSRKITPKHTTQSQHAYLCNPYSYITYTYIIFLIPPKSPQPTPHSPNEIPKTQHPLPSRDHTTSPHASVSSHSPSSCH